MWILGLHSTISPETAAMLKARRVELGLSLRRAGKRCGCSYEHIRRLELGVVAPKVYTAEYIIKGYGLEGEAAERLMREAVPRGRIADRISPERMAEMGLARDADGYLYCANPANVNDNDSR